MREKAYCYRKLWRKPLTIHSLGKGLGWLTFSKGLEVRQIIVALLFSALLLVFRQEINAFLPYQLYFAVYGLIPWYVAGLLCKKKGDGKRLDRYWLGLIRFMFDRKFSYSNHKALYKPQMNKKQSFGHFEVKIDD